MTYGYTITWTTQYGKTSVSCDGYSTPFEAFSLTLEAALGSGWTPKRWWQFWRIGDTDIRDFLDSHSKSKSMFR